VAHEYLAPLYGTTTGRHPGELGWRDELLSIEGGHTLLLSACKKAERADALILRFWNVAKRPTATRMRLRRRPSSVRLVDLKEQPIEHGELLVADDGSFVVSAGPAKIVTIEIGV